MEAMLSIVLLAIFALGISTPYISGFQALDVQADHMLLDSQLRSRMEVLIGTDFDTLSQRLGGGHRKRAKFYRYLERGSH